MNARISLNQNAVLFDAISHKLAQIGYRNGLLETDYGFRDSFLSNEPERIAPLAAFGQTPPSYETACFAVVYADEAQGIDLVQQYRALGAPYLFEIRDGNFIHWSVGKNRNTTVQRGTFTIDEIDAEFAKNLGDWLPNSILRAKNISYAKVPRQLGLFDHELIPEIESRIKGRLDPLVNDACRDAVLTFKETAGREPDGRQLFKLALWMLAGKVFRDRGLVKFQKLTTDSPVDDVLSHVADHYGEPMPRLLNHESREAVFKKIWGQFDFRNLSIDVLTHIWAETFISSADRKRLGIHATPRPIAKFIVDNLPFDKVKDGNGLIIEPCCGSATFLVAALQRLRDLLPADMNPKQRHKYFRDRLVGFEQDSFGVEISRLCLTLKDYPNPNGWKLYERDVFASRDFNELMGEAKIVLCNPPFEDFGKIDRIKYTLSSVKRPLELLHRVLDRLHPDGVLGFVMPRVFVDGNGYGDLRKSLAERFSDIQIVALPDKAFDTADTETTLVIASQPNRTRAVTTRVGYAKVRECDIEDFLSTNRTSFFDSAVVSADQAKQRLSVQPLSSVWNRLKHLSRLGDIARIRRGIEWNSPLVFSSGKNKGKETGNRERLVLERPRNGYKVGVPPLAKFLSYESPHLRYLSFLPHDQRSKSFNKPWELPKVILNKATKSRGYWRVAAFADFDGLTFYQTFLGVWPEDSRLVIPITAILNGPVGNAYISTLEGKVDITAETLGGIPIPDFTDSQIAEMNALIQEYKNAITITLATPPDYERAKIILLKIDAIVLKSYDLAPRIERLLLDFFGDSQRQVPFNFGRYFPAEFKPYFSLLDYISDDFQNTKASVWQSKFRTPPKHIVEAMQTAENYFGGTK